jgi:ComF family protein
MRRMPAIWNDFTHLFFPHTCMGCGTDNLDPKVPLCIHCTDQLPVTNFHLNENNPIEKYFWGRLPITVGMSLCPFTPGSLIQQLVHQLKYNGNKEIGIFLGTRMGKMLMRSERYTDIDALVPLPLHSSKENKRGYNQATLLCKGMAAIMQIPVFENVVQRLKANETQTHKNRIERWSNTEGRFQLRDPDLIKGKTLLLVDDVVTTGATLEACGQELLKAAGCKLGIATLAYTV